MISDRNAFDGKLLLSSLSCHIANCSHNDVAMPMQSDMANTFLSIVAFAVVYTIISIVVLVVVRAMIAIIVLVVVCAMIAIIVHPVTGLAQENFSRHPPLHSLTTVHVIFKPRNVSNSP